MGEISLIQGLLALGAGIVSIVILTTRFGLHAFFALIIACVVVGLSIGIPFSEIVSVGKTGFGNIVGSLGLIIVFGTTLGTILEWSGATQVLANGILRITGKRRAAEAMTLVGYVVGLPIFCDSGYMVMSSLNRDLARRTGTAMALMATALAAGLYAVHCLIPPHPGAAAATGALKADFGRVILFGMAVAVPTAYCGLRWARYAARRHSFSQAYEEQPDAPADPQVLPSFRRSSLPIALPIVLIGIRSFLSDTGQSLPLEVIRTLGLPEVALAIGTLLAITCRRRWTRDDLQALLRRAVERAGDILLIIGAGGAFGAIIARTDLTTHLAAGGFVEHMGILFPFLLAALLKTAQGSSSVAIITAATMVEPTLATLGLADDTGRILAVLALGAGSMVVSHANDSYFWVIARFSGVGMTPMLRVFTTTTLVMGLTAMAAIYLLALIF